MQRKIYRVPYKYHVLTSTGFRFLLNINYIVSNIGQFSSWYPTLSLGSEHKAIEFSILYSHWHPKETRLFYNKSLEIDSVKLKFSSIHLLNELFTNTKLIIINHRTIHLYKDRLDFYKFYIYNSNFIIKIYWIFIKIKRKPCS